MKSQKFAFLASLMVVMILAAGCAQSSPDPQPTSIITPTLTVTSSPTPTPISLLTFTPTFVPTLPVEEAQTQFLDLLSNNGGCRLPCLWGITPGRSTIQDAQLILVPLSSLSRFKDLLPSPITIDPIYKEDDLEIATNSSFVYGNDGIIGSIFFRAREFRVGEPGNPTTLKPVFDSRRFGERLRPYMLSQVLSEQGVPNKVLISTDGGENTGNNVPGFYILLLYPDRGILVNYTTNKELIRGNVRGCPPNAHVEMELYPPGQTELFFESLKQTDWGITKNGYKPLEEATSMSVEEFYEIFRNPTDKCIETPVNIWPTPER